MLKQLGKLKQLFSISTGLISLSYFNSHAYAINLGATSPDDADGELLIQRLEEIANNYTNLSSMLLALNLTSTNTGEISPQLKNNSVALTSLGTDRDESSSPQTSNYLAILIGELTKSKTDSSSSNPFIVVEEPEFSARNLFGYITHSIKKLNINQPIELNGVSKISILPQVDSGDIYKDVYDFDITSNKQVNDLNSSLSNVFNNKQNFNSQVSNILSGKNESISYAGLQHQLVNSAQVGGIRSSSNDFFSNSSQSFAGENFGGSSENWFQHFGRGEMYANPAGLVSPISESHVNRQLRLQQRGQRNGLKSKFYRRR